jgi:hypothetical protein
LLHWTDKWLHHHVNGRAKGNGFNQLIVDATNNLKAYPTPELSW